jgi:hypothetical protein
MAVEHYPSAELIYVWSFYRQCSSEATSSADAFLMRLWFGDPDPRLGTTWEKGERLAKLVARHRPGGTTMLPAMLETRRFQNDDTAYFTSNLMLT